jgi:NOL1/NOP2/sun family putative RNA methylase
MDLPIEFTNKIQTLLGEESNRFFSHLQDESPIGIRTNPIKINRHDFLSVVAAKESSIPWCRDGFFLHEEKSAVTKHPYYHAGLCYVQEPSAMIPAEALQVEPGQWVLDLCAAPGGKTTQIAGKLANSGLLIANDVSPKRLAPLIQKVQAFGITNTFVTHESPERLGNIFAGQFDRVLVDAPCSGEGMFSRNPRSIQQWSPDYVNECATLQREILVDAIKMLAPGGILVYSTCTFSPEENEGAIQWILDHYPQMAVDPLTEFPELSPSDPAWVEGDESLSGARRAWPHRIKGYGHFIARLKDQRPVQKRPMQFETEIEPPALFQSWQEENLKTRLTGAFHQKKDKLYLYPKELPDAAKSSLRSPLPGLYLGDLKKNRFQPSQALAMSLSKDQVKRTVDFAVTAPESLKYLRGDTILQGSANKGWTLITVDDHPVGWAKQTGNHLKNQIPAGWKYD